MAPWTVGEVDGEGWAVGVDNIVRVSQLKELMDQLV